MIKYEINYKNFSVESSPDISTDDFEKQIFNGTEWKFSGLKSIIFPAKKWNTLSIAK